MKAWVGNRAAAVQLRNSQAGNLTFLFLLLQFFLKELVLKFPINSTEIGGNVSSSSGATGRLEFIVNRPQGPCKDHEI